MSKHKNVEAALKLVRERAAKDDNLLKLLDDIDRLSDGVAPQTADDVARSRQPYSSPPPIIEPAWK